VQLRRRRERARGVLHGRRQAIRRRRGGRQQSDRRQARQQRVRVRAALAYLRNETRLPGSHWVAAFFVPMPNILKILVCVATAAGAVCAYAQMDPAQMAAAREKAQVCVACHGPDGNSQNPDYPILAGQSWRYIYIELKDFKEGRRSDPQMSPMAANLSQEDMVALGNFFAVQKPAPIKFQVDGAKVEAGRKTSDATLCPMCHLGGFVGQNEIPRV